VIPPDKPYEGLVLADGWHPVKTEVLENNYQFAYASSRFLNEIIKGIAIVN
jgi:hypothetical protein